MESTSPLQMPTVSPNLNGQLVGPAVVGLSFRFPLIVWAIAHLSLSLGSGTPGFSQD